MDATSPSTSSDSHKSESYSQVYGPDETEISLHIDKLTLVLEMPSQLSDGMFEYLWGCTKDPSFLASAGLTRAFGANSRGYKLSLAGRVPSHNGGGGWSPNTGFLIQVGPKSSADPPMRLDINPECLTPHGFTHMRNTLTGIILVDWPWVQLARVTRVDAALDVQGCSPNDWAWDMTKRRKRQMYLLDRETRTIYLGDKHGDWLAVYDKARQLNLPEGVFRTRIEFRKRSAGPVQELAGMACPFANLLIFDPTTIPNLVDPLRAAMMTIGQTKGMKGVTALFPNTMQAQCQEKLLASTPEWWNPQAIWKEWPVMLNATLPGLFGVPPEAIALAESHAKSPVPKSGSASASSPPPG
jgi:hypothetical protein